MSCINNEGGIDLQWLSMTWPNLPLVNTIFNACKFEPFDRLEMSKYSHKIQQIQTLLLQLSTLFNAFEYIVRILALTLLTRHFFANHNLPQLVCMND